MKELDVEIRYFSGTGQCRQLSEYIADELKKGAYSVKLENITPPFMREKLVGEVSCRQLIIVFPVYGSHLPLPLESYLKKLAAINTTAILIAEWGNAHNGKTLFTACEILRQGGFTINGAAEIVTLHSYFGKELPIHAKRPTQSEKEQLMQYINRRLFVNEPVSVPVHRDGLAERILSAMPQGSVANKVVTLSLDKDKCSGCGVCEKMCPMGAINKDFTVDKRKCIMCLSCVTNCKEKARTHTVKPIAIKALGHHQKIEHENALYE